MQENLVETVRRTPRRGQPKQQDLTEAAKPEAELVSQAITQLEMALKSIKGGFVPRNWMKNVKAARKAITGDLNKAMTSAYGTGWDTKFSWSELRGGS